MRRLGLVASVFLLLAAVPAEAVQPGYEQNGRVAFASDRDGDYEIYSIKDDGTDLVKLTDNAGADLSPDWSPNGSRIVFTSNRDGDHDIYAMDPGGGNVVQITNRPGYESGPVWSGFGTRIAFIAQMQNGESIGFVNADGSGLDVPNGGAQYGGVSWSSDDALLVYSLGDPFDPSFQIYTQNLASGTGEHITGGSNPDWSPDMSTVAFDAGAGNADIWVVTPVQAGGMTTRLTTTAGFDVAPRWSPDGQEITWMTSRDGNYEIYKMHQDGTSPVRLTNHSGSDVWPDWQPVVGTPLPGYPRPRGATPVRVALVPAFRACTSPGLNHGPPLSFPSCAPQQRSPHITVGTPDANGSPAESTGSVRLDALVGSPGPPEDSDVLVTTAIDDVRCAGSGSPCPQANASGMPDYGGEVQTAITVRLTDRYANAIPLTTTDIPFRFPGGCVPTGDTGRGSSCTVGTSLNAHVPGAIRERKRMIFALDQVQVQDGGPDGSVETPNGMQPFAVQGVFVP